MFGSKKFYEQPPEEIRKVLNIWYQKERPALFGKQVLTQPFYYKSLIGRKVLDIIPSYNDDNLYLLLEGNIKIELNYSTVSSLDYNDTSFFKATDIQSILYDPIYCFGYSFEPKIVFFDWFDIYLYVMALLDIVF